MVQWKDEVTREQSGRKAELLDSVEHFNVPNFFVVTRDEISDFVSGKRDQRELLNSELSENLSETLDDAYREIGMSSEVREAAGKARNLVGGQRENQMVSVRISGSEPGSTKFRLNVGSNKLEEAFKEVLASYYRQDRDDVPAVIVQKMIEPEHSGAIIPSYLDSYTLIETVQGLGVGLERGIVTPTRYLVHSGEMEEMKKPDSQVKITKHPLNGGNKRRKVMLDSAPFSSSEIKELAGKVEDEDAGIKFAYKRGTFYAVDAFSSGSSNPFSSSETSLEGIRVSKGRIEGTVGEDIAFRDETHPPQGYDKGLISRKGGFTSTDAQRARKAGKPAIFSYTGHIEEGEQVKTDEKSVSIRKDETGSEGFSISGQADSSVVNNAAGVSATSVVSLTSYVPEKQPINSYRDFFMFEGGEAVVDARQLEAEALDEALKYLENRGGVMVVSDLSSVEKAVRYGFEEIVVPGDRIEEFSREAERQERKFILQKLREEDSS